MENLGGFDPSTMTYSFTHIAHPNVADNGVDPFQEMLLPMDLPDHHSTYPGYAASEDLSLHMQPQATPQLKRFSSTYDDPFSDVVSAFDPIGPDQQDSESPSIDRDNKLLSFSFPAFDYTLLDYTYRRSTLSLSAQLHGMFFLAESPWAAAGDAQAPPSELTCYRRNLFQIKGDITVPRTLRYIMTEQGEQIDILGQELVISATESTEGNPVKIISVPWKTPSNANVPTSEDKVEREPPSIPLDLMNVQELDSEFATFPFQWKRLQFRIATANNGRRKELQQHFVVRLKVLATLATGGKVPICEVQSGAIIVRGRSPRNFQSRKDLPLNGSGHARKGSNLPAARTSSNDSVGTGVKRTHDGAPTSIPIKTEGQTQTLQPFFDSTTTTTTDATEQQQQQQPDFFDWKAATIPPPTTSPFQSPNTTTAPTTTNKKPPINLSLTDSDSPPARKRLHIRPPPPPPAPLTLSLLNSPDEAESADLLYEYFPLGLDDWMPPVDAVYRPHVVHHTKLPWTTMTDPRDPNYKAGRAGGAGGGARSRRYFSEDVT